MSNLLAGCVITNVWTDKSSSNPKQIVDGELRFSGASSSCGSTYIKIKNTGYTYYWDCEVEVSTGNQFYFGFERYDANKSSLSNYSCVYTIIISNTGTERKHYSGRVDFATPLSNGSMVDTVALRILSGWSGSTDAANSTATVYSLSLREVQTNTLTTPDIDKCGVVTSDFFNELDNTRIYNDSIVESNTFIEI